jgi:hypothetical protein
MPSFGFLRRNMTGPVLSFDGSDVLEIMRNTTGRVDRNDPAFTDAIMYNYLNIFLQAQHPTELRLFEDQTWWDFQISPFTLNPMPVDLDALGFSTIGPLAYVSYVDYALNPNTFKMFWYEDPGDFYYRWPWNAIFTPQQPTYVLYYNQELTFRGPPDRFYNVRISANKIKIYFAGGSIGNPPDEIPGVTTVMPAYLIRYLAYGASLDILSDYGEMDKYNEVYGVYRRYRGQVLARTWDQLSSQRTNPDF